MPEPDKTTQSGQTADFIKDPLGAKTAIIRP
jgi:hypothetical protein